MNDEKALIAAIAQNPDDDTVRLAYADWLEEHDQAERAELIRKQIALSTGINPETSATFTQDQRAAFEKRTQELLTAHRKEWLPGLSELKAPAIESEEVSFERGFPVLIGDMLRASDSSNLERLKTLLEISPTEINAIHATEHVYYSDRIRNRTLLTALIGSWEGEQKTAIRNFLLDHPQIDINREDGRHTTPLQRAIQVDCYPAFLKLVQRPDMDVSRKNTLGQDAMTYLSMVPRATDNANWPWYARRLNEAAVTPRAGRQHPRVNHTTHDPLSKL